MLDKKQKHDHTQYKTTIKQNKTITNIKQNNKNKPNTIEQTNNKITINIIARKDINSRKVWRNQKVMMVVVIRLNDINT